MAARSAVEGGTSLRRRATIEFLANTGYLPIASVFLELLVGREAPLWVNSLRADAALA